MALIITAIAALGENPVIANPKAVPDAGGCSVSITTIMKIESPTAREYKRMTDTTLGCGIKEHKEPEMRPTKWPPITFLGLAVMLFGIANTIKAVAPMDAMITAWCKLKNKSTMNIVRVAKRL